MAGGKRNAKKTTSSTGGDCQDQGTSASLVPCGKCKKIIRDDLESSIECETCHLWFHCSCVNVPEAVLDFLGVRGLHWYCFTCDQSTKRLEQIENKVDKIQEIVSNTYEAKIGPLQKTYAEALAKLENNSSILTSAAKATIKKQDEESKQRREKNVIIFGLTETTIEETISEVKCILDECHIHTTVDKNTLFRLGKHDKSGKHDNPKPVKLCTDGKSKKWDILVAINKLKRPNVFARLDMSKEEQEEDFRLRMEMKNMREKHPSKKYKIKNKEIVEVEE